MTYHQQWYTHAQSPLEAANQRSQYSKQGNLNQLLRRSRINCCAYSSSTFNATSNRNSHCRTRSRIQIKHESHTYRLLLSLSCAKTLLKSINELLTSIRLLSVISAKSIVFSDNTENWEKISDCWSWSTFVCSTKLCMFSDSCRLSSIVCIESCYVSAHRYTPS